MEKENQLPAKQGVMYELNIDKDQGPYLSKDIMHSNPRSITLLAGSQIMNSFSSLNQTLKLTETKQKEYTQSLSSIESFSAIVQNIEEGIQINLVKDKKLKAEEIKLRQQFYVLNEGIIQANVQLLEEYMPLLTGLHKIVKEQASRQKEQIFRMEKELKNIGDARRQLLEGVFRCQEKIVTIESLFGTKLLGSSNP